MNLTWEVFIKIKLVFCSDNNHKNLKSSRTLWEGTIKKIVQSQWDHEYTAKQNNARKKLDFTGLITVQKLICTTTKTKDMFHKEETTFMTKNKMLNQRSFHRFWVLDKPVNNNIYVYRILAWNHITAHLSVFNWFKSSEITT